MLSKAICERCSRYQDILPYHTVNVKILESKEPQFKIKWWCAEERSLGPIKYEQMATPCIPPDDCSFCLEHVLETQTTY